jgi:hypothetical protein
MMPGRHHHLGPGPTLLLLLAASWLVVGLLVFAAGCAVVYIGHAPRLQHVSAGNPACVIACDTSAAATNTDGAASSVERAASPPAAASRPHVHIFQERER